MASKNDQVFPVSLSEIAFILIFVLMLLLGFMIMQERQAKDDVLRELANVRQTEDALAATEVMNRAKERLQNALIERGVNNPAEVVQALVNAGEESAKQKRIQQESLDLTKKLVALEELRSQIEEAGQDKADKVTRERVESALELQQQIEALVNESSHFSDGESQTTNTKQFALDRVKEALDASKELREQAKKKLNIEVKPGGEVIAVRDVVEGARIAAGMTAGKSSLSTLNAENDKLKTQVAFYEKRDRLRGLDHPPCWMDKESKIEYIFNVQTTSAGFVVTPGWPASRENDARSSEGFATLMDSKGAPLSASQFQLGAKPYLDYGKRQTPECRHFVFLSSSISEADRRDNARRLVNSFFYVLERRAPTAPSLP